MVYYGLKQSENTMYIFFSIGVLNSDQTDVAIRCNRDSKPLITDED